MEHPDFEHFELVPVKLIANFLKRKGRKSGVWLSGNLVEEDKILRIKVISPWQINFESDKRKTELVNVEAREEEFISEEIKKHIGKQDEVWLLTPKKGKRGRRKKQE